MKNILFLLSFLFLLNIAQTQIYYCGDDSRIGIFNVEDCTYTTLPASQPGIFVGDITFTPEGRLIGLGYTQEQDYLIELTLGAEITYDTLIAIPNLVGALACDEDGLLYLGGTQTYTYDLTSGIFEYAYANPTNRPFAGDFVFYEGNLYGSAFDFHIETTYNEFAVIELLIPNDTFHGEIITFDYPQFGGLAKYYDYEQDRFRLIGVAPSNIVGPAQSGIFHEIFLADTTHQELCELTMEGNPPRGLAGTDDFRTNFALRLDLDADDSSGRFLDHYLSDSLCAISYRLADEDMVIQTTGGSIDSLVVDIHAGVQQPGQEILTATPHPAFAVTVTDATRLVAVPTAPVTGDDYADFIRGLRFELTNADPLPGERRIDLRLYQEGIPSDGSYAFVRVRPEVALYAGQDYSLELCPYNVANLMTGLGPDAYQEGYWVPALQVDNNFYEPSTGDQPGTYRYIAQEGSCGPDTAVVQISTSPVPPLNYGGVAVDFQVVYLCPGDTAVWTIDTDYTDFWFWNSDASSDTTQIITDPIVEGFQFIDNDGCEHYYRTVFLTPDWGDQPQIDRDTVTACAGTLLDFYGRTVSMDTTLCELIDASTGDCGYELCRTFRFEYAAAFALDATICQGETYAWYGQELGTAGTYQHVQASTDEQCDTLYTLTLEVTPAPAVAQTGRFCQGDTYPWFEQTLNAPGTYEFLATGDGCDTLYQLTLAQDSSYVRDLAVSITAGESYAVGDSVFTAAGTYTVPLLTAAGCDSIIELTLDVVNDTDDLTFTDCGLANVWQRGLRPWEWHCATSVTLHAWALYDSRGRQVHAATPRATATRFTLLSAAAQTQLPAGVYFYDLRFRETGTDRRESGKVVVF